ncbi:MAG: hypothetical protein ACJ77K_09810 [Bacteroidia bacterium]
MKRKKLFPLVLGMISVSASMQAQTSAGPYTVRNSEEFESPKKHVISDPIAYGDKGIVQINIQKAKSFSFQLFNTDLVYQKENTVSTEGLLNERVQYQRAVKLKDKTYFFFRDVFRDEDKEGISALEFDPDKLEFKGASTNLFKSSDRVRIGGVMIGYGFGVAGSAGEGYGFELSEDKTKFLYTYALQPKERKDELNKDIIGMYTFDENLKQLWGAEFEMPYTEAKMDNLGYTVADDGKVYMLARVYEGETPKEGRGRGADKTAPNYHFEVLVYDKGTKTPKSIEIKLDNHFPKASYIYEDAAHNIILAGFYGKAYNKPVDGAYMVKLDVASGTFSKVNGGYYEIPSDIIKSYTSDREKRKLEKKESKDDDHDIGIDNLQIRDIYSMPDGSTKIVSEQYVVVETYYYDMNCKCMRTRYDTYADDIFVMSIEKDGKLGFVKKIPKSQHAAGAYGAGISINSLAVGNDVHIFYIDNIKNMDLPPTEAPKRHEDRRGGFLTGVTVTAKGDVKKYSLGEIEKYETNFFIREFVPGGRNNLISTERKKRKNTLFSIDVK